MVVEVEKLANEGAVILVDMEVDKLAEDVAVVDMEVDDYWDTFNIKESLKVLDDNKEMFELVGGLLCVNAVVGMRVVMNEISNQNTHRIQTNATCATIPQSHNPTHAHPQWREIARVHRMQKVIQPSWKSEHSYAHSHWGESPHLCTVQKVIQTNWKIDGAHLHRQWEKPHS